VSLGGSAIRGFALQHRQSLRQVAQKWKQRKHRLRTAIPSDFAAFANKPVSGSPSETHHPSCAKNERGRLFKTAFVGGEEKLMIVQPLTSDDRPPV